MYWTEQNTRGPLVSSVLGVARDLLLLLTFLTSIRTLLYRDVPCHSCAELIRRLFQPMSFYNKLLWFQCEASRRLCSAFQWASLYQMDISKIFDYNILHCWYKCAEWNHGKRWSDYHRTISLTLPSLTPIWSGAFLYLFYFFYYLSFISFHYIHNIFMLFNIHTEKYREFQARVSLFSILFVI